MGRSSSDGDHEVRVDIAQCSSHAGGGASVLVGDAAEDHAAGTRPARRGHPVRDREVRAEVDDRDAGPPRRDRKCEGTELVTRPGRQPDEDGACGWRGPTPGLECGRKTALDGMARGVFRGHVEAAGCPRIAKGCKGRQEMGVDDLFV